MLTSSLYTIRAVLFDLDGTLLDTAPDMIRALNLLVQEEGLPAVDHAVARQHVSHGAGALVKLGFGDTQSDTDYQRRCQRYLELYQQNLCVDTVLFDGMAETLAFLEDQQIAWGVVTNKPAFLTEPLLKALDLDRRCASIISGDSLPQRKPHPQPLFHAANECNVLATECIYVGDAERDIIAGNRAGMITLLASYGYISADDQPEQWGANGIIRHAQEILDWLTEATEETLDTQRSH
ncbi:MAG: phosphoglycolate phosphatase [Proteobacteria bacterium]|nr:MAG: phosphoglycolate phosphatase [Pseudomonadota bacterium]